MTRPDKLPQTLDEAIAQISGWSDIHCDNYYWGVTAMIKVHEARGEGDTPLIGFIQIMIGHVRDELSERSGTELTDHQLSARDMTDAQLDRELKRTSWCLAHLSRRDAPELKATANELRGVITDEIARRRLLGGEAGPAV